MSLHSVFPQQPHTLSEKNKFPLLLIISYRDDFIDAFMFLSLIIAHIAKTAVSTLSNILHI